MNIISCVYSETKSSDIVFVFVAACFIHRFLLLVKIMFVNSSLNERRKIYVCLNFFLLIDWSFN